MEPEIEKLLTPKEAAEILKVKVSTVKRWLREGKLKGQKLGRLWRIRHEDLEELKELGLGYQYQGHAPGHIRGALEEAFDDQEKEWWQTFDRTEDAFLLLGKLWHCTDIVPHLLREDIADWLEQKNIGYRYPSEKIDKLRKGCTYAQAVRLLKEELTNILET